MIVQHAGKTALLTAKNTTVGRPASAHGFADATDQLGEKPQVTWIDNVPARAWAETLDPAGLGARRVSDALQWLARSQFVRLESCHGSPPAVTLLRASCCEVLDAWHPRGVGHCMGLPVAAAPTRVTLAKPRTTSSGP